jgi:3,4-dihydroxy 2-butanone 4-phosphate synthase
MQKEIQFKKLSFDRIKNAIHELSQGRGILLLDSDRRENEADIIFAAETLTEQSMALMIRYCSGIVCLCLDEHYLKKLDLPMMVANNTSNYQTAFTVSIEAKNGVTTGVSAADRVTTILTAIKDNCKPEDLARPGHIFPLRACLGGVLEREGHTEGAVDLMRLAGLKPAAVLCELMNDNGTMAKLPEIIPFAERFKMPLVYIDDIVLIRKELVDTSLLSHDKI